ncbi:MAG: class I SAM-dependent methyltransferase [Pseudomonadota bacterium]
MRPRIKLGRFLIRLGRFINSLAVVVMRPDDLVEFGRQTYAHPESVEHLCREETVDLGLTSEETALLEKTPLKRGRLLLLGVGGGREAIPLARLGFDVTGVDFVGDLVRRSIENAKERGATISGLVQEISTLDVPDKSYDIVWLSAAMYSCIPTRRRRVDMLRRIRKALEPGGYFICQFRWDTRGGPSHRGALARKAAAFLTVGNLQYEPGDMLWGNAEFVHAFSSEDALRWEFTEGGFEVVLIQISNEMMMGGAVLKR